jgi:regulatory protein
VKDFEKALNYSFLLLKYRPRSRGEIEQRLKRKEFPPSVIKKVVDRLEEYNYINDAEFVRLFVSSSITKGWGKRRIVSALRKLKVSEQLYERFLPDKDTYRNRLRQLIRSKLKSYKGKRNIYQRIVRFLINRGFEYNDIYREMQDIDLAKFK